MSGPITWSTDVDRLLVALDRRLRARRIVGFADGPDASALLDAGEELGALDLRAFTAPYYDVRRGGRLERLAKRLLNLPLRVLGRPQQYANEALVASLESSAAALRAALGAQGALLDLLGMQAARLEPATDPTPAAPPPGDRPLRIALLSRTYPPHEDVGGVARYTHTLAHALADLGHEVHVVTEGARGERRDAERLVVHTVGADPLPVAPGSPMVDRILRWAVAAALRVEALAVDVVESHNWESESIGVLRAGRTPVVVRIATPHLVVAREAGWAPSPDLADAIALERWLTAEADGVSHSTDAIRETIERDLAVTIGDDRRALIPFGMTLPPDAPATEGGPPRLLFVGRLEARKGADTVLAAVPSLLQRHPALVVDVVGKDVAPSGRSLRREFEAAHELAPWRARCRFHGVVDDRTLDAFYRDCTVFTAPSRYESFGLIYLEAMRWGKPVVACRAGGVPEVVRDGETGLLVPPGDAGALEAAVSRLLDDAALRARMGSRARALMESEFSTSSMAERTVALYRRAIARHAGRDRQAPRITV